MSNRISDRKVTIRAYEGPAGGWGSAQSVTKYLAQEGAHRTGPPLIHQNKPEGYACVSCSWAKPAKPHPFEFCENGAKATAWELTTSVADPRFFETHGIAELRTWPDHDLEKQGRITHPLRHDRLTDRWLPTSWEEAFAAIGERLAKVDPRRAVFYTSGRASLETSYLFQLFARLYGTNNLPDSSNMCHETTSVALPKSIGVSVGTVRLPDFETTELMLFFGHNIGSNAPRMLHQLQQARKRGVPIITLNPLIERGLERFTNPQSPVEMALRQETLISTGYHQVQAGGDLAAITGIAKGVLALDDAAREKGTARVLDMAFIAEHTHGFEAFDAFLRKAEWSAIERQSGLARETLEDVARLYARSPRTIALYGMGLTQHRNSVQTVHMLVNLLLMRGNLGKPGAGICPIRGHSNVQGQRTVGITEKPELAPLDQMARRYGFEPPRWEGMTTVDACEAVLRKDVDAFIGLGGNFLRAVPETAAMEEAWGRIGLTVHIATKLNRTHLVPGETAFLLPCLGRIEIDEQAGGVQAVSVEDSTACIHGSRGRAVPISSECRSEPAIVAGIAKATLPYNPKVDWDGFVADYRRVRDAIEESFPKDFKDFNRRMWQPGGFPRPLAAAERRWETDTGKANFLLADPSLNGHGLTLGDGRLRLITLRSNDQFNTTIYGYEDRFRGISGTRMVVFVNRRDMQRLGVAEGESVSLVSDAEDGIERVVSGLTVVPYNIPDGCIGAYYPECNPLIAVSHYATDAKVPAAKSVPVKLRRADGAGSALPDPVPEDAARPAAPPPPAE